MQGERFSAILGAAAPIIAIIFILASIMSTSWFSWWRNALSDLGHSRLSDVAALYNFGLLLSGFLLTIYAVKSLSGRYKYTSYSLLLSSLLLQLVAVFDESYGRLHTLVSVLFFVSLLPSSVAYAIEGEPRIAAPSLIVGLAVWILYFSGTIKVGVAVPEIISAMAASIWIIHSAMKVYVTAGKT